MANIEMNRIVPLNQLEQEADDDYHFGFDEAQTDMATPFEHEKESSHFQKGLRCGIAAVLALLLVAAVIAATVVNLWILNNRFESKSTVLDGNLVNNINLLVQDCTVIFRRDVGLEDNQIRIESLTDNRDEASVSVANQDLNLRYIVGVGEQLDVNASIVSGDPSLNLRVDCLAEITLGSAVTLTDMTIDARGPESRVSLAEVNATGVLGVVGEELNLRTNACTFASVSASIGSGILDLSSITITDLATGILAFIAQAGDVIVGPNNADTAELTWSNPCGFVCLPDGQFVDDSACTLPDVCAEVNCTGNKTTTQTCYDRVCAGDIVTALPKASSAGTIKLSLSTLFGSIYVFDPQLVVGQTAVHNASLTKPISLGDDLVLELTTIFDQADLTAEDVVASVFFRTFSPDTAFLLSTNPVYFEIEPAYISTFSATLLRPLHARIATTLQPGFCPYRAAPTISERGQVADLLQAEARLSRDRSRVLERVGHEKNLAFVQQSTTPLVYTTSEVGPSVALIIALTMAFVLAAIIGVLGTYLGFYGFVTMALTMARQQEEQANVDRYLQAAQAEEAEAKLAGPGLAGSLSVSTEAGGLVDESRTNPVFLSDNKEPEFQLPPSSLEGVWSIFDVGPALIMAAYRYYIAKSVKQFAKDIKQPMLWPDFIDSYEQFCQRYGYMPQELSMDDTGKLAEAGLVLKTYLSRTYGFTKLRLKDPSKVDNRPVPIDDTFIASFLDVCCESTPFEYDYVLEDDLMDQYADFERTHQCEGRYPLKDSLLTTLGHRMVLIPLRVVLPKERMDAFEEQVRTEGVASILSDMRKEGTTAVQEGGSAQWLIDIIVHLLVNVVLFVSLPLPYIAVALLFQQESQSLALARDRFFTVEEVILGPDPSASSWPSSYIAWQNQVLFYATLVYYGLLVIDFTVFLLEHFDILKTANYVVMLAYCAAKDENEGRKVDYYKGSKGWRVFFTFVGLRYIVHKVLASMVAFGCCLAMGYVGLVAVWASLAAIINPTRFLAYTTGVLSSVTLVVGRYRSIAMLRDKLRKQVNKVTERVRQRARNAIKHSMQSVLDEFSDGSDGNGKGGMAAQILSATGLKDLNVAAVADEVMEMVENPKAALENVSLDAQLVMQRNLGKIFKQLATRRGLSQEAIDILVQMVEQRSSQDRITALLPLLLAELDTGLDGTAIEAIEAMIDLLFSVSARPSASDVIHHVQGSEICLQLLAQVRLGSRPEEQGLNMAVVIKALDRHLSGSMSSEDLLMWVLDQADCLHYKWVIQNFQFLRSCRLSKLNEDDEVTKMLLSKSLPPSFLAQLETNDSLHVALTALEFALRLNHPEHGIHLESASYVQNRLAVLLQAMGSFNDHQQQVIVKLAYQLVMCSSLLRSPDGLPTAVDFLFNIFRGGEATRFQMETIGRFAFRRVYAWPALVLTKATVPDFFADCPLPGLGKAERDHLVQHIGPALQTGHTSLWKKVTNRYSNTNQPDVINLLTNVRTMYEQEFGTDAWDAAATGLAGFCQVPQSLFKAVATLCRGLAQPAHGVPKDSIVDRLHAVDVLVASHPQLRAIASKLKTYMHEAHGAWLSVHDSLGPLWPLLQASALEQRSSTRYLVQFLKKFVPSELQEEMRFLLELAFDGNASPVTLNRNDGATFQRFLARLFTAISGRFHGDGSAEQRKNNYTLWETIEPALAQNSTTISKLQAIMKVAGGRGVGLEPEDAECLAEMLRCNSRLLYIALTQLHGSDPSTFAEEVHSQLEEYITARFNLSEDALDVLTALSSGNMYYSDTLAQAFRIDPIHLDCMLMLTALDPRSFAAHLPNLQAILQVEESAMAAVSSALFVIDCADQLLNCFPDELKPVMHAVIGLSNPHATNRAVFLKFLAEATGDRFTYPDHQNLFFLYSGHIAKYCEVSHRNRFDAVVQAALFSLASVFPDELVDGDVFRGQSSPSQLVVYGSRLVTHLENLFEFATGVSEYDMMVAHRLPKSDLLSFARLLTVVYHFYALLEYVERPNGMSIRIHNVLKILEGDIATAGKSLPFVLTLLDGREMPTTLPAALLAAVAQAGRAQGAWRRAPGNHSRRNEAILGVAQAFVARAGLGNLTHELTEELKRMLVESAEATGVYRVLVPRYVDDFIGSCNKGKRVNVNHFKAILGIRLGYRVKLQERLAGLLAALGVGSHKARQDMTACINLVMGDLRALPQVAELLNIPTDLTRIMMLPARLRCARRDKLPYDVNPDMVTDFAPAVSMLSRYLPSLGRLLAKDILLICSALTGNHAAVQTMLFSSDVDCDVSIVQGVLALADSAGPYSRFRDYKAATIRALVDGMFGLIPQQSRKSTDTASHAAAVLEELSAIRSGSFEQYTQWLVKRQSSDGSVTFGSPLMVLLHRSINSGLAAEHARTDSSIVMFVGAYKQLETNELFSQLASLSKHNYHPHALTAAMPELTSIFGSFDHPFFKAICGLVDGDRQSRVEALAQLMNCMFASERFARSLSRVPPEARRALSLILSVLSPTPRLASAPPHNQLSFASQSRQSPSSPGRGNTAPSSRQSRLPPPLHANTSGQGSTTAIPGPVLDFFHRLPRCGNPADVMRLVTSTLMPEAEYDDSMADLLVGLERPTSKTLRALEPLLDVIGQGAGLERDQLQAVKCLGTIILFSSDWPHALKVLSRDMLSFKSASDKATVETLLYVLATCMKWKQVYGDPEVIESCATRLIELVELPAKQADRVKVVIRAALALALSHREIEFEELSTIASLIHPRITGSMLRALLAFQQKDYDNASELLALFAVQPSSLTSLNKVKHATNFSNRRTISLQQALKVGQTGRDRLNKINNKEDLVNNFDADGSGTLDREEFKQLVAYYKAPNPVSDGLVYRLFVKYKSPTDDSVPLTRAYAALSDLDKDVQGRLLQVFKLSSGHVVAAIVSLLLVLSVFLVFIFTGIIAFTSASNFNSVINSLLTLGGVGSAGKVTDNISSLIDDDDLEQLIDRLDRGDIPSLEVSEDDVMAAAE